MMKAMNCPQCGAAMAGPMPGLPVATCGSCNALLAIGANDVRQVGDSGTMPFDVSPLQIGTTLLVDGQRGEIVGRERWGWERGAWNEWLLFLSGDDHRWVAEEAGLYMVMQPVTLRGDVRQRIAGMAATGAKALGETVQLDHVRYTAADFKVIRCIAAEGHLPVAIPATFPRRSLDFRSASGKALTWQEDASGTGCWTGHYCRLAELGAANLRRLQGWDRPDFGLESQPHSGRAA